MAACYSSSMIHADAGQNACAGTAGTTSRQYVERQRSCDGSESRSSGRSRGDSTPPSSPNDTSQISIQSKSNHAEATPTSHLAGAKTAVAPAFHLQDGLHSGQRTAGQRFQPLRSTSSPLPEQPSIRKQFGLSRLKLAKDHGPSQVSTPRSPMSPSPTTERFMTAQISSYATRSRENSTVEHRHRSPSSPTVRGRMALGKEASAYSPSMRARGASTSAQSGATPQSIPPMPLRPSKSIPDSTSAGDLRSQYHNIPPSHYQPRSRYSPRKNGRSMRDGGGQPRPDGYSEEEIRASFRSALTSSSSIVGASTTEVSSITTQESTNGVTFDC